MEHSAPLHNIPRKKAQVNREQKEGYFANLSKEISISFDSYASILKIFNMDESAFMTIQVKKALIPQRLSAPRNYKKCHKILLHSYIYVNAAGETLSPFLFSKEKN